MKHVHAQAVFTGVQSQGVALAALSGEKTVAELSSEFKVHQTVIHKWRRQLKESTPAIFAGEIKTEEVRQGKEIQALHAKIGQLTMERDFLAEAWHYHFHGWTWQMAR